MQNADVIVVGAGLAGLSAAYYLAKEGKKIVVFESRSVLGGRTSSWTDEVMPMESGLHRFLSFYEALPDLLNEVDVDIDKMLHWENKIEVRIPNGPRGVFGTSLLHNLPGLLAGSIGNNDVLSIEDKASLVPFLTKGIAQYVKDPLELDKFTVSEYAKKHGVTERVIDTLLYSLTAGLFFLPPQQYSAFVFFNTVSHLEHKFYDFREGSFMGGMTEVMIQPIVEKIEELGGIVKVSMPVEKLVVENERVIGVRVKRKKYQADHVVLASSIGPAKKILKDAFPKHPWLAKFHKLPQMIERNLQIELKEPGLPFDHIVFGTYGTLAGTFAEQSRTTFRNTKGRLSVVLTQPDILSDMKPKDIFSKVLQELKAYGVDISDSVKSYKVVDHLEDWYSLTPGAEQFKPTQETPIHGLTLAGDYTKQEYLATMEGAVISGKRAADAVLRT